MNLFPLYETWPKGLLICDRWKNIGSLWIGRYSRTLDHLLHEYFVPSGHEQTSADLLAWRRVWSPLIGRLSLNQTEPSLWGRSTWRRWNRMIKHDVKKENWGERRRKAIPKRGLISRRWENWDQVTVDNDVAPRSDKDGNVLYRLMKNTWTNAHSRPCRTLNKKDMEKVVVVNDMISNQLRLKRFCKTSQDMTSALLPLQAVGSCVDLHDLSSWPRVVSYIKKRGVRDSRVSKAASCTIIWR